MTSQTNYILIYTKQSTPRLDYLLYVLFHHIVQVPYRVTNRTEEFQSYVGPRVQYTVSSPSQAKIIHIPKCGLLHHNIRLEDFVAKTDWEGIPALFPMEGHFTDYPFDLFSTCFYLLSFFEMYHPGKVKDDLRRFPPSSSLAYEYGFLDRPIVDEWCLHLVQKIQTVWPNFKVAFPNYQFTPTYDIDVTWAYGHRPFLRQAGSIARDTIKADFKNLGRRWQVQVQKKTDPFYTFPFLDELHHKYKLDPIYFFLLGDYAGLDRNIHPEEPTQRQLFKDLASQYRCGLHPSIKSNQETGQLTKEILRYQSITGKKVYRSRQHYLVFDIPTTFRRLIQQGINEEYSIGYANVPGFRAGIARPFPWYDLLQEEQTELMIHPFIIMDQGLRNIAGKDHHSLTEKFLYFAQTIRAVNGHLYTLWHNSSFSAIEGWTGWKQHYEAIIIKALP